MSGSKNLVCLLMMTFFSAAYANPVEKYSYKIINHYPHSENAFTQGLFMHKGYLYEGTGVYGQSTLSKLDLPSGQVLKSLKLDSKYFGEGITILDDKIYQLTYHAGICFVYDEKNFKLLHQFNYDGEGWGLTTDGHALIMSNGSSNIFYRDKNNFKTIKKLTATFKGTPIKNINALAYRDGKIFANVWMTNKVIEISAKTGGILAFIDFEALPPTALRFNNPNAVLNGIAALSKKDEFLITGKYWPVIYKIKITHP